MYDCVNRGNFSRARQLWEQKGRLLNTQDPAQMEVLRSRLCPAGAADTLTPALDEVREKIAATQEAVGADYGAFVLSTTPFDISSICALKREQAADIFGTRNEHYEDLNLLHGTAREEQQRARHVDAVVQRLVVCCLQMVAHCRWHGT